MRRSDSSMRSMSTRDCADDRSVHLPESFPSPDKSKYVNAASLPISGGRVPAEARGTGQQAKIRLLKNHAEEGEKQTRAKSRFADHIPANVIAEWKP